MVKQWSSNGQAMAKRWSSSGQAVVLHVILHETLHFVQGDVGAKPYSNVILNVARPYSNVILNVAKRNEGSHAETHAKRPQRNTQKDLSNCLTTA